MPSLARSPDELTAANVASSTIESVGAFAGPALGGVVIAVSGPGVSFAIAAGTFLWSALLLAGIRMAAAAEAEEASPAESERVLHVVSAGARAVVSDPRARLIVALVSAQTLVAGSLLVFLPVLALELLDWGEEGFGAINAACGIGGMIGAGAAVALVGVRRLSRPLALGTVLWGVPIALVAVWDTKAGALVLLGVVGLANTIVDVSAYTLLQRVVPDAVLARVFGILESLIYGTHALGGVLAAVLVEAFGLRAALVAAGLFLPVCVVLAWSRLARLDSDVDVPERALALLRGVPFLAVLPAAALEALARRALAVTVPAGEAVFGQGDHGDRFYAIAEGEAGVTIDGEELPAFSAGDWFGEIALLRDVPRTATITARTDLDLLALERDDFIAAVTGHAPTAEAAGAVVGARLAARPALAPV